MKFDHALCAPLPRHVTPESAHRTRGTADEFIEGHFYPHEGALHGSAVYGSKRNVIAMNGILALQTQSPKSLWALIFGVGLDGN